VVVPPYCRDRQGRVFRILRSSELIAPGRVRFALRAQSITLTESDPGIELSRELDTTTVLDKIANGQAVPTPEGTFEDLWQLLRQELDSRDG
jgi:hypothetical protein